VVNDGFNKRCCKVLVPWLNNVLNKGQLPVLHAF